jgi:hypothetical protein
MKPLPKSLRIFLAVELRAAELVRYYLRIFNYFHLVSSNLLQPEG